MTFRQQGLSLSIFDTFYSSVAVIDSFTGKISTLFDIPYSNYQNGISHVPSSTKKSSFRFPRIKLPNFNNFKFGKKTAVKIILPVIALLVGIWVFAQAFSPRPTAIQGVVDTSVDKPISEMMINREFSFPLRDEANDEVASFRYVVESAEKRKQIIVRGDRATAVEGRVFLIINIKVVNELDQGININTRDYARILVNGNNNELFAPDIHNDPVEVQAISTKATRIGLAINEDDRDIILRIGEIGGEKQDIKLEL